MIIHSLEEYLNAIQKTMKDKYEDDTYRIYFRGESFRYKKDGIDTRCLPKVFRTGDEKNNYYTFLRRYPNEFIGLSNLEILSKMQHHGISTRLLDITSNPLVALFFACGGYEFTKDRIDKYGDYYYDAGKEYESSNGQIYIFTPKIETISEAKKDLLTFDSDRALLLSTLPKMTDNQKLDIYNLSNYCINNKITEIKPDTISKCTDNGIDKQIKGSFGKFIYECERERDAFKDHHVNPKDLQNIFYVKPPYVSERIKLQSGLFIIFGLKFTKDIDERIVIDNKYFRDLIVDQKDKLIEVDSKSKVRILAELKFLCGISYSSLFDGLEATLLEPKEILYKNFKDGLRIKNHETY